MSLTNMHPVARLEDITEPLHIALMDSISLDDARSLIAAFGEFQARRARVIDKQPIGRALIETVIGACEFIIDRENDALQTDAPDDPMLDVDDAFRLRLQTGRRQDVRLHPPRRVRLRLQR